MTKVSNWNLLNSPDSPELEAAIVRAKATVAKREASDAQKRAGEVIQFPLWPESTVGVPDVFLRSALFAATENTHQKYYSEPTTIAAVAGYDIKYQGNQLTVSHQAVWEMLVQLARGHPLGTECVFSGHAFLKIIGYKGKIGKSAYDWLDQIIRDLAANTVETRIAGRFAFGESLIRSYGRDEQTRLYKIVFERGIIGLFAKHEWTMLQIAQRLRLRNRPLAYRLHGLYSSHAAPFPYKVATIRELTGSEIKELFNFRKALRRALDTIKAQGVISAWDIDPDTDLVTVSRNPSDSQQGRIKKDKLKKERRTKDRAYWKRSPAHP